MADETSEQNLEAIPDALKCIICLDRLKDAHMCCSCSKLVCRECLKQWLKKRKTCPHCTVTADKHGFARCRFEEEVTKVITGMAEKLRNTEQVLEMHLTRKRRHSDDDLSGQNHKRKMEVFCDTCQVAMSVQTALGVDGHKEHKIILIDEAYEVQKPKTQEQIKIMSKNDLEIAKEIEAVYVIKDALVKEKEECIRKFTARLEAMVKTRVDYYNEYQGYLQKESMAVEKVIADMETLHKISNPSEYTQMFPKLYRKSLDLKTIDEMQTVPFTIDLSSDYDCGIFVVRNFSDLQQKSGVAVSPILHLPDLSFQLRVFPNGSGGEDRGESLSVTLTSSPGLSYMQFDCVIEMVRQVTDEKKNTKNIEKRFICTSNDSLPGFPHFYPLDALAKDGYLDPKKDTLLFNLKVKRLL